MLVRTVKSYLTSTLMKETFLTGFSQHNKSRHQSRPDGVVVMPIEGREIFGPQTGSAKGQRHTSCGIQILLRHKPATDIRKSAQPTSTSYPTSTNKEPPRHLSKQQRLMRIQRIVSHAIRPAPSPPEASRSTSNPPSRSPIITVAVVKVYFASCFCDLV